MGNFSRNTYDATKKYASVRLQQGVPLVDADWNEQDDIRRKELQKVLSSCLGNGVPTVGQNGFCISPTVANSNVDFVIASGSILVDGILVVNDLTIQYTHQLLYTTPAKVTEWNQGLPATQQISGPSPLTVPGSNRTDLVYIDVWEREVSAQEEPNLVDVRIGVETCVRLKYEWVVRVIENYTGIAPTLPNGHFFCQLALLSRQGATMTITDLRTTTMNLSNLTDEIHDARGIKGNLGNRLDESLTAGGKLRQHIVEREQFGPTLDSQYQSVLNHLSNYANPHATTAVQVGALPLAGYEFKNRTTIQLIYSQTDTNGALRNVNAGFVPRFISVVGYCNGYLANQYFGTNFSGFADLKTPIIQQCSGTRITRTTVAPFWRQEGYTSNRLCSASFTDTTISPDRDSTFGVHINSVTETIIQFALVRLDPVPTTNVTKQAIPFFELKCSIIVYG